MQEPNQENREAYKASSADESRKEPAPESKTNGGEPVPAPEPGPTDNPDEPFPFPEPDVHEEAEPDLG